MFPDWKTSNLPINGVQLALDALEMCAEARRNAERQMLAGLRQSIGWLPLVNVGLMLAEIASRRQRQFERSFFLQMKGAMAVRDSRRRESVFAEEPERARPSHVAAFPTGLAPRQAPTQRPAMRLKVPLAAQAVAMPLHLRNHRTVPEAVELAVIPPPAGLPAFPPGLIHFEPETLVIPPQSTGSVQLVLKLEGHFQVGQEYWAEIVIAGLETKQIPLVLEICADMPVAGPTA